ncbi:hypothetical protein DFS33DRAFT_1354798 [Desarmillaria ectypa]|nr:hypothetical protein DFS33DRAFT_1354798 [Desarmillaria ectypa]
MDVPPHAIAQISSVMTSMPEHIQLTLVRDGHVLYITIPPVPQSNGNPARDKLAKWKNHHLDLIETLLHTIDFMQTSAAFLVSPRNGSSHLVPKPRSHLDFTVTYPTWGRLIDEREINITGWWDAEHRKGRWNDLDVEVFVGFDEFSLRSIQITMASLDVLRQRNLDLHFEVLGHLIRDDKVVGIVMEPNDGRFVERHDRALVYNAFQELQKHNILVNFAQFSFSNVKIVNRKVRMDTSTLQSLKDASCELDPEQIALARQNHWAALNSMMTFFDIYIHPAIVNPAPALIAAHVNDGRLLAYIPFPERPLLLDIRYKAHYRSNLIWNRHRKAVAQRSSLPLPPGCRDDDDAEYAEMEDTPFVSIREVTLSRTSRRRQEYHYEPYRRPNILCSSAWSDVSDATWTSEGDTYI